MNEERAVEIMMQFLRAQVPFFQAMGWFPAKEAWKPLGLDWEEILS
jgi:hypothetical protein